MAASRSSAFSQRDQDGRRLPTRSSVVALNDDTTAASQVAIRRGAPRRGDDLDRRVALDALEFDIQEGSPAGGGEDGGQCRDAEGGEGRVVGGVDPIVTPVDAFQRLVVDHHGCPVGGQLDIELQAVAGRDGQGRGERVERVLRRPPPVTAMRQPQRVVIRSRAAR